MPIPRAPLFPWLQERSAGILLHPTALPGPFGIGNFGAGARRFVNFLADARAKYWQMCPLGPTGFGDSPYQCFSAFAGNPYLIDLAPLLEKKLLAEEEVAGLRALPANRADFGQLYARLGPVLRAAYQRFKNDPAVLADMGDFEAFRAAERAWLQPYALFMALKQHFGGRMWSDWPAEWRSYRTAFSRPPSAEIAESVAATEFTQFLFFSQWRALREYAASKGIGIIGDIPIFVAPDSADVWTHPELFQLDPQTGRPTHVAGVPPDYFSPLGQLWGNPLFNWDALAESRYTWWMDRFRASFALYDIVRLDHFRGFDEYWSVPAGAADARGGRWRPGPGLPLFETLQEKIPDARIIAEDLGLITDSVIALREGTGLPGMAVLQFAFGSGADNFYLPHNLQPNCVVYSGTHDNDTTVSWYRGATAKVQDEFRRYLRSSGDAPHWDLIHAAYKSVCRLAIVPLQDVFGLGGEARFNAPGTAVGNWQWRFTDTQLDYAWGTLLSHVRDLAENSGRQAPRPRGATKPGFATAPASATVGRSV